MRIDPVLAQLRRDPAPQLRAQAALEAIRDGWRAKPVVAKILAGLDAYGRGAPLGECAVLENTLADLEFAGEVLGALLEPLLAGLCAHPLGHVPLRHQHSAGLGVLQLAIAGRATLSLVIYEAQPAARRQDAQSVCFAGGERHELCMAGSAQVRLLEILREEPGRSDLDCVARTIGAGDRLVFAGARHTKLVDRPLGRLVILRLARSEVSPGPAREYRLADGALVHCASGDREESRTEMAIAVLGALRRRDAVPAIAAVACDGSDHLRWQALCQALALDTGAGFALLTGIAGDPADPLAVPAGALRATLIERHPELALWSRPCPV